jgi:hypothetical protein
MWLGKDPEKWCMYVLRLPHVNISGLVATGFGPVVVTNGGKAIGIVPDKDGLGEMVTGKIPIVVTDGFRVIGTGINKK